MSSIKDLIAKKQKELAAKKGHPRTYKPAAGKTRIRILPSWRGLDDGQFWHDYGVHFVKDAEDNLKSIYLCTDATFGTDCPVCQAIGQGIKHSNDDSIAKILKSSNAGQRYLLNVLVLSDDAKKNEPQVMEVGSKIFEQICEVISEYDDISDLNTGTDINISRKGTGMLDTVYTVTPCAKSNAVPKAIYDKVANLDEYVAQENDTEKMKAITTISNVAGFIAKDTSDDAYGGPALEAPKAKAAPIKTVEPVDDMSDVIDDEDLIEDAEIVPEKAEATGDDLSEDDLDDLLADLG